MRNRFQIPALMAVVLSALLLPTAAGAAPVDGSGTFIVSSAGVVSARQADGNTFLTLHVTTLYSGTLQGTGVGEEAVVVHSDGTLTASTFETFTGVVGGVMGTALLRVEGTGDITSSAVSGQFAIVNGTGGLASLHGMGIFRAFADSGTYSVTYLP